MAYKRKQKQFIIETKIAQNRNNKWLRKNVQSSSKKIQNRNKNGLEQKNCLEQKQQVAQNRHKKILEQKKWLRTDTNIIQRIKTKTVCDRSNTKLTNFDRSNKVAQNSNIKWLRIETGIAQPRNKNCF